MRFVRDVHIPIRLSKFLAAQEAVESVHMDQILDGSTTSDLSICQHADAHDCIVITKDADFRNSYFLRRTPRKLIRISLDNLPNDELIRLFQEHLSLIRQLNREESFYIEINVDSVRLF